MTLKLRRRTFKYTWMSATFAQMKPEDAWLVMQELTLVVNIGHRSGQCFSSFLTYYTLHYWTSEKSSHVVHNKPALTFWKWIFAFLYWQVNVKWHIIRKNWFQALQYLLSKSMNLIILNRLKPNFALFRAQIKTLRLIVDVGSSAKWPDLKLMSWKTTKVCNILNCRWRKVGSIYIYILLFLLCMSFLLWDASEILSEKCESHVFIIPVLFWIQHKCHYVGTCCTPHSTASFFLFFILNRCYFLVTWLTWTTSCRNIDEMMFCKHPSLGDACCLLCTGSGTVTFCVTVILGVREGTGSLADMIQTSV